MFVWLVEVDLMLEISCTSPSWIYWYLKIDHLWGTENHAYILSEPVTLIVNDILMSGEFPSLWKRAEVFPVSMKSNPENIKDYRPISLLYQPSKIAERYISHKIQEGIPNTPNQYAYTRQLGTTEPQNHLLMPCLLNVLFWPLSSAKSLDVGAFPSWITGRQLTTVCSAW